MTSVRVGRGTSLPLYRLRVVLRQALYGAFSTVSFLPALRDLASWSGIIYACRGLSLRLRLSGRYLFWATRFTAPYRGSFRFTFAHIALRTARL
jgi:hypothetical protein